jgi:hypothetical protein
MTLRSLTSGSASGVDHADFLDRAEILGALGVDALISRFRPYYELTDYLSFYTDAMIGLAVGLPTVREIADESPYTGLPGGVLESADGRRGVPRDQAELSLQPMSENEFQGDQERRDSHEQNAAAFTRSQYDSPRRLRSNHLQGRF